MTSRPVKELCPPGDFNPISKPGIKFTDLLRAAAQANWSTGAKGVLILAGVLVTNPSHQVQVGTVEGFPRFSHVAILIETSRYQKVHSVP